MEQIKLFTDHEVKGSCDHAIGIVSEGDAGECKLYDNTRTVPVKSYTLPNFMSSFVALYHTSTYILTYC